MLSIQDLTRAFIDMEREANLFSFKYGGVPVWWFARDRVLTELFNRISQIDLGARSADSLSVLGIIDKVIDSLHLQTLKKHDILALSTSSARRVREDQQDYDVFFDFLSSTHFTGDYAVLETPDRWHHSKRPYSPVRYYGDYLSMTGNSHRRLARLGSDSHADSEIGDFCKKLHGALSYSGYIIDFDRLLSIVAKEYSFARASGVVAERYLDRISPKLLLVECGYSPSHMVIQYAAKKRGIPVIEVQHGLIVPDSAGYFFGITDASQLGDSPFPDRILLFGSHFKRVLLNNPFLTSIHMDVVGFPFLWKIKERYFKTDRSNNSGKVLIASQAELAPFFVELASLIKSIDKKVILKVHPSEAGQAEIVYKDLNTQGIKVITSNISIYELLKDVEFHLAVGSMTHLEAIALGVKTIIFAKSGFEKYYGFLTDMGIPTVTDAAELIRAMQSYPNIDNVLSYVQSEVFTMNQNPVAAIESILDQYLV
jgi:hypothetical protein